MARGPQETTRLVRGGPLITTILSNRSKSTHNNGGYKSIIDITKNKNFRFNDCNIQIEVIEFGRELQIFGALKQYSKLFGIGSAGMRTKMRRNSSIIIMNMATSNKKIQKKRW